jgi:alpha-aminoadipic semialdehyde synthase
MPACRVDPVAGITSAGYLGDGIIPLAVDNLSCELPKDASTFFSYRFKPFVPCLLSADYNSSLEASNLPEEIKKAVIVYSGELIPYYEYLESYLEK